MRALYHDLMHGWNSGSAKAFAAPFAEVCDFVAFDGTRFTSRQELVSFHQPLFETWLKGTRLVGTVERIRLLTPDVAVMTAVGGTMMRGKRNAARARDSVQTLVATRTDGRWQLAAFQNTRLRVMGSSFAAVVVWTVTDWLWTVVLGTRRQRWGNGGLR